MNLLGKPIFPDGLLIRSDDLRTNHVFTQEINCHKDTFKYYPCLDFVMFPSAREYSGKLYSEIYRVRENINDEIEATGW